MLELTSTLVRRQQEAIRGAIHLTRWKEHSPLIFLTLLGAMVAFSIHNIVLDWRLLSVAMANFLTVCFAFMVNDIEDAGDDRRSPVSAARNPVTNGMLDERIAWFAAWCVALMALAFYVPGGRWVMTVGMLNLLLSLLYSWRPVRLKSSAIGLDIVSHTLMLGGLLPLAGYLVYSHELTVGILWIVVAATLGSTYGQLYNQVRDFHADQAAGIMNATTRMGIRMARGMMYIAVLLAIGTGILGVSELRFPSWAIPATAVAILMGLVSVAFTRTDASGKPPLDFTGRLQNAFWIVLGLLIIVWVLWALGWMSS